MIVLFVIKFVVISKRNKFLAFFVSLLIIVLLFFFFQGFFVFVDGIGFVPRYFVGFSVFVALISLFLIKPPYKYFAIPAFVLAYCFFVYVLAFGNVLADQSRFKTFFATMLVHDLSKIITTEEQLENTNIYLMERIGNAPSVKRLQKDYPITKKLIPNDFGNHAFGYINLAWYNFPATRPDKISKQMKQEAKNLPKLVDTYYYTIRGDNNNLYIWFNNR